MKGLKISKRISKLLIILSMTGLFPLETAQAKDLITRICLAGFKSEMIQASINPPLGMGEFTCNCFRNEVQEGASITLAKTTCKALALKKYNP